MSSVAESKINRIAYSEYHNSVYFYVKKALKKHRYYYWNKIYTVSLPGWHATFNTGSSDVHRVNIPIIMSSYGDRYLLLGARWFQSDGVEWFVLRYAKRYGCLFVNPSCWHISSISTSLYLVFPQIAPHRLSLRLCSKTPRNLPMLLLLKDSSPFRNLICHVSFSIGKNT